MRRTTLHCAACCLATLGLLASACASAPRSGPGSVDPDEELPAGWHMDKATADFVHDATGFHFAPMHGECRRDLPRNYDATGDNTAIGYSCRESGAWLTLYVYPTSFGGMPDPPQHFRGVVGDVLSAKPGAQVERAVQGPVPLGPRELPGFIAYLRWFEAENEVGSFVVLVPDGDRFVKVRTSVGLGVADENLDLAWRLTSQVLSALTEGAEPPAQGSTR